MLSSKQKGDIAENRIIELITYTTDGSATCYRPVADDDGIDIIVNLKSKLSPLFIQVKSRYVLNKQKRYIQNVGINTFTADEKFYLVFVLMNNVSLDIECIWLIPSVDFKEKAYFKKKGDSYKAFYRFTANPVSTKDKWSDYIISKNGIGKKIMELL